MNQEFPKRNLIVMVGPTSVGKTNLSLEIAKKFRCEIISGDSMQVYCGMDIGTAKATAEEREAVHHHLIDIREPDQPFSVTEFQELAGNAVEEILEKGSVPFIVGGSGLYIESFCYGFAFSEGGMDEAFRKGQEQYAQLHGLAVLHSRLREVDPDSAARIHPNNMRRVIRALEIIHMTGVSMTQTHSDQIQRPRYNQCIIGLAMDRSKLYRRIEERVDRMMAQGLVHEVNRLLNKGFNKHMIAMQGLGYKEIISYLQGEHTLEEAVLILKQSTRNYAKRQMSWFRHMKDIQWVDVTDEENFYVHLNLISDIIAEKFYKGS